MAFDTDTRNKLAKMVANARDLLKKEFTQQLQEIYGIQPDGKITALEKLAHLDDEQRDIARVLRERVAYISGRLSAGKKQVKVAVDRMTREQSFTVLNRFTALRMCEERGLLQQCVGGGLQSKGFQVYLKTAGIGLGGQYERFRTFIFSIFDEIAIDLGILFNRFSPFGLLFPREPALDELLEVINRKELNHIWAEDEAIGWIYQYFNSPEERKDMRKASTAPRNSRELAVRNQFFTPRYVVEFLTDNTLGRIWFEMRQGDTSLKDNCRYLVRRPNEVFLETGKEPPKEDESSNDNLSQEELLNKTTYIPFRAQKDPRDLKILDPACGSGHFLLYTFDLLETIYEEAWQGKNSPPSDATGRSLREDFESLDELRKVIPELIIRWNLHGIDIDPRAVQIAAMSLWLRAQRSWQKQRIGSAQRPRLTKSNIVCAEPMPGDENMLKEFADSLKPKVLGQLVEVIFDKMKLAGESGSLLKIEEEIKDSVAKARKQWEIKPKPEQARLFPGLQRPIPKQQELQYDVKDIDDAKFWDRAESLILQSLQKYSEQAENGLENRRKMFAEDAAQGFAFIDLCRKRFEVLLMNPPFGEFSQATRSFGDLIYPLVSRELYAAFIERGKELCTLNGLLGAISSRTGFFIKSLNSWRERVVLPFGIRLFAELGEGILDSALVETAIYVLGPHNDKLHETFLSIFIRLPEMEDKSYELSREIERIRQNKISVSKLLFQNVFNSIQDTPLAYWLPTEFLTTFKKLCKIEGNAATIKVGLQTGDDFRFIRAFWEIPPKEITNDGCGKYKWVPHAKGGENSPFWSDIHLLVKWYKKGSEVKAHHQSRPQNRDFYFKSGLTFPYRVFRFSPAALPKGCITGVAGMGIFPLTVSESALLSALNTNVVNKFVGIWLGRIEMGSLYQAGTIQSAPFPIIDLAVEKKLAHLGKMQTIMRIKHNFSVETSRHFIAPIIIRTLDLKAASSEYELEINKLKSESMYMFKEADAILRSLYELETVPDNFFTEYHKAESTFEHTLNFPPHDQKTSAFDLLSYSIGCAFGRWDIRVVKNRSLVTMIDDPFAPLPICSPGMLLGSNGLPAKSDGIVSEELLRARLVSITMPIEDEIKKHTISNTGYPLRISWNGILSGDHGLESSLPHEDDILRRVREVLDLIWGDQVAEIEQEICEALKVSDLLIFFHKPSGFFANHLARYSKSRRKAPIYWPLSTESGSYTLWLYYHRLSDQTLFTCVNDYVSPKIETISKDIERLQKELSEAGNAKKRAELEKLQDFRQELIDFRDELLRVAKLPYKLNLNDGVMITAAPLWSLFRLKKWQNDLKACWEKLKAGDYDWAHLAYSIWPDRVREKCKTDRSLAIAHNLEHLCEIEPKKTKKKKV